MKSLNSKYFNRINLFYVLIFSFFCSCSTNERSITIIGFDQVQWINDSLACGNYRVEHYELLSNSKSVLIGETEEKILNFLGQANRLIERTNGKSFFYFIKEGEQCLPNGGNKLKLAENEILEVRFTDGKVDNIGIQVP